MTRADGTLPLALWRCVAVGALAGLLFGFDTAVIAGTTGGLRKAFALNESQLGITVSMALWGTLVGALTAGRPGDRWGARTCLRWVGAIYLVAGAGSALSGSWWGLLVFRFLAGLGVGASSVLAPVYIAEISPPARRGALVGTFQLNIVVGILLAYLSNYLVGQLDLGEVDWRVKFAVSCLPAGLLTLLSFTIPHSPRWLALQTLQRQHPAARPRLSWALHRKPMLLAIAIAAFNQLSGINAILYYLNDIFAAAGFDALSADRQAVAIGVMNLVFTVVGMLSIDRVGRKVLLVIGSIGLTFALSGVAVVLETERGTGLLLYLLAMFIAFFAVSQGAVIWVYISEIFPSEVRAQGQSLGSSVHWFMDAVIALGFPIIAHRSAAAPFWVAALMMVLQIYVVGRYFPETKRQSLDTIAV